MQGWGEAWRDAQPVEVKAHNQKYKMCRGELCELAVAQACARCVPAVRSLYASSDPLGLELHAVMSCPNWGAGNQIPVLNKSGKLS